MERNDILWTAAGSAILVGLALLLLLPPAAAQNDPGPSGGGVYSDWTVTDARSYSGVAIYLESSNLTVQAGGSLSLTGVALRFNNTQDGGFSLTVQAGGTLSLDGGTNISSNASGVHYRFVVQGSMTMNGSAASEMWGDTGSWAGGIQVYSSSVSITNSTIFNGRTGGISIFDCSPTISGCNIKNNGQDGASQQYCFGIYGTGTDANITGNNISDNRYSFRYYYDYNVTKSPTSGTLWNGNYYSTYSASPRYRRTETIKVYTRSNIYGYGVWLEGDSTATLRNNSITQNGWETGGKTWSDPAFLEDPPTNDHQVTRNWNVYAGNKCYGAGVTWRNSTVEIRENKIDRNAFDPYKVSLNDLNYMSSYWGTGITLVGCTGNVANNTIMNGAALISNLDSSPNITSNLLYTDFVHTLFPSGSRIGYGIVNYRSSPYIFANTITLTVEDQERTIGPLSFFPMDSMVGIDNTLSPGITIEKNTIVTETRMANYVSGICVNATFLSNDLKLINNTFEHKQTGRGGQKVNMFYSMVVQLSFLSDTVLQNNLLKSNAVLSGGGGGGNVGAITTPVAGLVVTYGTKASVLNCTITTMNYGVMLTDYGALEAVSLKVLSSVNSGVYMEPGCSLDLDGCQVTGSGNAIGLQVSGSSVDILNCVFNDAVDFQLDKGAVVEVRNSTLSGLSYVVYDRDSYMNISWPVKLAVTWQNGKPVDNASVSVRNRFGEVLYQGITGPDGRPAPLRWIKEYMLHNQTVLKYRPNPIYISKGRATSLTIVSIGAPANLSLILVDSVPPELLISSPSSGALLNNRTVEFRGEVLEEESGLRPASVEVNFDNTEWSPVAVVGGHWSFSSSLADGSHILWVRATDAMGNSATSTVSFTVETTAPTLSILSPADGSFTGQRTVTVTGVSDPGASVTVNGKVAELQDRVFSARLSLEEGPNLITVVAVDAAGNSRTVTALVTLDTIAPELKISAPADGAYSSQNEILITGTTEPLATVLVGGHPGEVTGSDFSALAGLSEGVNDIPIVAVDRAGNSNALTLRVFVVTSPPDLSLFGPPDGLWTAATQVLVSGATERGVSVMVNGVNANVVGTLFSISVPLSDGANRIAVVALDAAGNANSVVRTVFFDNHAPGLLVASPADGSSFGSRVVAVRGSADQDAEVRVNGVLVNVADFIFSTTIAFPEDGTYRIEVSARDPAGNIAVVVRTVNIDTTAPLITLDSPAEGAKLSGRTVDVTGHTEPFATVTVNDQTMVIADATGRFSVRVVLDQGVKYVTVRSVNAAGLSTSESRSVRAGAPAPSANEEWVLGISGMLLELGIAALVVAIGVTAYFRFGRGRPAKPDKGDEAGGGGKEEDDSESDEGEEEEEEEKDEGAGDETEKDAAPGKDQKARKGGDKE